MTLQDTAGLMKILSRAYPRDRTFNDPVKVADTVEVWAMLLADLPASAVVAAVKKHCMTNVWPPSVAEIRAAVAEAENPGIQIDAGTAWGEVTAAIRWYGYYREEEALASLSDTTRAAAKSIGWKELCTSENADVIRGQFRMAFETMANRHRKDATLPPEFRPQIQARGLQRLFTPIRDITEDDDDDAV